MRQCSWGHCVLERRGRQDVWLHTRRSYRELSGSKSSAFPCEDAVKLIPYLILHQMVIPSQYKERHCCGISRRTEDTMKYIRSVLAYQIGGLGGGGGERKREH